MGTPGLWPRKVYDNDQLGLWSLYRMKWVLCIAVKYNLFSYGCATLITCGLIMHFLNAINHPITHETLSSDL